MRSKLDIPAALVVAAVSLTGVGISISAAPSEHMATIVALPLDDRPEGIAFDSAGRLFVSNRRLENGAKISEILEVSRSGAVSVFATLEQSGDPAAEGILGLATDPSGALYAAIVSFDPAIHGVWQLAPDRSTRRRLSGSEMMIFPNALTFDVRGNLYATDSIGGAIWRFSDLPSGEEWVNHALLGPGNPIAPLLPPIGANGIAFVPPNSLFVANTESGAIVRVSIQADGSPGTPTLVVRDFRLASLDGLAADVHGLLHGVVPGSALFGTHPLVHVDPATGEISQTTVDPTAFHFPLSLAFGAGAWDPRSVYVTNGGALFPVPGPGPGVIRVRVGIPGVH